MFARFSPLVENIEFHHDYVARKDAIVNRVVDPYLNPIEFIHRQSISVLKLKQLTKRFSQGRQEDSVFFSLVISDPMASLVSIRNECAHENTE